MTSRIGQRDPLWWTVWLSLLVVVAFASRSYIPIHETRYLAAAWDMWLRGDFLVPFMNGEPYSHKPPLLLWLIHAGWLVSGVNDWWPRLVAPLLALSSLFLVRRIASLLWPDIPLAARLSPWILLASLLWALYSQAIMFDLLLAVCVLLGMLALVHASQRRRHAWPLFALAVGLGILAKGPAVLLPLLPPALLAPWWLGQGRGGEVGGWRRWYRVFFLALLGGAALGLAWAIPAGLAGGEAYRNAIFWGQSADRLVDSFAHRHPFWWYLPLLPALLYPWFVWPAFWRGLRHINREMDAGLRLTLVWLLPSFLAFSLISGKQVHYLLPEFPAFALLAGRLLALQHRPARPWLPALGLAVVGALILLLPVVKLPADLKALAEVPSWGGVAFLALALWLAMQRDTPERLTARIAGAVLLGMMLLHLILIRPLAPAYDMRPISRFIADLQAQGRPVANIGKYYGQYQFAGRLRQPIAVLPPGQEPIDWLARHPNGVIVLYFPMKTDLRPYQPLFTQPYRSGQAALFDASRARIPLTLSVRPE